MSERAPVLTYAERTATRVMDKIVFDKLATASLAEDAEGVPSLGEQLYDAHNFGMRASSTAPDWNEMDELSKGVYHRMANRVRQMVRLWWQHDAHRVIADLLTDAGLPDRDRGNPLLPDAPADMEFVGETTAGGSVEVENRVAALEAGRTADERHVQITELLLQTRDWAACTLVALLIVVGMILYLLFSR